jgi:hypothetical protein
MFSPLIASALTSIADFFPLAAAGLSGSSASLTTYSGSSEYWSPPPPPPPGIDPVLSFFLRRAWTLAWAPLPKNGPTRQWSFRFTPSGPLVPPFLVLPVGAMATVFSFCLLSDSARPSKDGDRAAADPSFE